MILKIITPYVLILVFFLCFSACNNSRTNANIYGNWKGSHNDHEIIFVFKNDSTCVLTLFNRQSNKLDTIKGIYDLDFSKKPIPLSIKKIPKLNHQLYTIVQFINNNSIRIAEFSPKWRLRPISFVNGKSINLKRIRQTLFNK